MRRARSVWTIGTMLLGGIAMTGGAAPLAAQEFKLGAITVTAPWTRATPGGVKTAAAYLGVRAAGAEDAIVGVSSPAAAKAELHTHIHEGGVMRMRRVDTIPIKSGEAVTLKPDGLHVMLIDLKGPLKAGESIELSLTFQKAGGLTIKVPIAAIGAAGPPSGGSAGGGSAGGGHGHHQHK